MAVSRARRGSRQAKHVKWSVAVPHRLARMAEDRVAAGEAPSLSAVVTRALERDLAPGSDDELDRLIQEWIATGQVTIADEVQAWADRVLAR